MQSKEFNSECISYLNNSFEVFSQSKEVLKKALAAFHTVCEKNGIPYYLAFGSLLGCVRDGLLMPPWDRDIDVVVFFKDRDRLIEALKKELDGDYGFECEITDTKFPYYQMHIFPKGYDSSSYHIDVFYLTTSVNRFRKVETWKAKVKKVFTLRKRKYSKIPENLNKQTRMLFKLFRFAYRIYPTVFLDARSRKLLKDSDGSLCGIIGSGAEVFPVNIFGEGKVLECEGVSVRVPSDWDAFLTIRYGDYRQYLPIADRFDEFIAGVKTLEKPGSRGNL